MTDALALLETLRASLPSETADTVLRHVRTLPARAADYAPWPEWGDADLIAGARAQGIGQPWRHQVDAADAIHAGRTTCLATSTGSGKSLGFWLPILSDIRSNCPRPAAIYLSPTKALGADQARHVHQWLAASAVTDLVVETCDGDTPTESRRWIETHADVILTNADFLHASLLPNTRRWARFLSRVTYVVVDEAHQLRGLHGAHVALVLTRLRRLIAARTGAMPVTITSSATTADPAVTAGLLAGVPPEEVHVVAQDGSPTAGRIVVLWRPPVLPDADRATPDGETADSPVAADPAPRRPAPTEAALLTARLVAAGARVLTFTRSRRTAETTMLTTRRVLATLAPGFADRIAAYRGGYLPEERRELEQGLQDGALRALATTNALEMGIDVAGLDAVITAGWPGSRASYWQQAGRAGRAGDTGLSVFVAREDPLDSFLVEHPAALLDAPVEASVFDPTNPYVLAPHLCAAAAEMPLRVADLAAFGPTARAVVDDLTAHGLLRLRPSGWHWTMPDPATVLTDLRGSGGTVQIVEDGTGAVLGTVDAATADATVHPGAVYTHQGRTFLVVDYDPNNDVARVSPASVQFTTWARWTTSVDLVDTRETRQADGPVVWSRGLVDVTSHVTGYQRRHQGDGAVLGTYALDLPERTLRTAACWWTVTPEVLAAAELDATHLPGALHAAEHASIGLLPIVATCDRSDLGGLSTVVHPQTGLPTVIVHEAFPGGAGLSERGFRNAHRWLTMTLEAIVACPCAAGCPACVQSPKCGNGNEPLDKAGAARLLREVLRHMPADLSDAA